MTFLLTSVLCLALDCALHFTFHRVLFLTPCGLWNKMEREVEWRIIGLKPACDCGNVMLLSGLSLWIHNRGPSSAQCQGRAWRTALNPRRGNILQQGGIICSRWEHSVSEHCYSMNDVTLEHCMSGFRSFISALRADSSEEFRANHTSLRISWLCNSLRAGADDLQQRGASPPWGGYCLLWDFPAHSGRN